MQWTAGRILSRGQVALQGVETHDQSNCPQPRLPGFIPPGREHEAGGEFPTEGQKRQQKEPLAEMDGDSHMSHKPLECNRTAGRDEGTVKSEAQPRDSTRTAVSVEVEA